MAKVSWTFQSLEDMADIATYHEQNSGQYASFLIDSFFAVEEQLSSFPFSGRVVPETNLSSIRELIVNRYRIIYSVPSVRSKCFSCSTYFHASFIDIKKTI